MPATRNDQTSLKLSRTSCQQLSTRGANAARTVRQHQGSDYAKGDSAVEQVRDMLIHTASVSQMDSKNSDKTELKDLFRHRFPAESDPNNERVAKLLPENVSENRREPLFDFSPITTARNVLPLSLLYPGLSEEQAKVLMEIEDEIAGWEWAEPYEQLEHDRFHAETRELLAKVDEALAEEFVSVDEENDGDEEGDEKGHSRNRDVE
ncbi:hypothetical protein VNI00_017282 [Paramarasmius palmivorus]|uniref:Uncharacterized protein n=1 Tax=Paramarasmius palmivorus TaxID=297713 RepID=A0AAW0B6W6_9AGAR